MRYRLARDAHAQALALDLDLGEVGFVEQLRQLADQVLFAQLRRPAVRRELENAAYACALTPTSDASPAIASA